MNEPGFFETQIVTLLKQADSGIEVNCLCRQVSISPPTYDQLDRVEEVPTFLR